MRLRTYLAWMVRESRGARGRMLYFAACLAAGVAAVVGTAALAESVKSGFRARSREILGADFRVESRRPIPAELTAAVAAMEGSRSVELVETPNMVATIAGGDGGAKSSLATLRAVTGPYPLYGEIETEPPGGLSAHLAPDGAVLAASLAETLGVAAGDRIRVGAGGFRVGAVVRSEPPSLGLASVLAPTVYLSREGFERTGRLGFGTHFEHKVLFALPGTPSEETLDALVKRLESEIPDKTGLDFDTHYEQNPGARRSTGRAEGFVGLVALLSLVVGGIGVGMIVKAWLADRAPSVAVMRCLGMRPGEILVLALGHATLLALAGSLVGAAVGCALPFLARGIAPDLFAGSTITIFPVGAILRGIGLGVGLALAFSLPPMTAIWRVPPARVLRADAEPLPANRLVATLAGLVLAGGVFAAASVQAAEVSHAVAFTAGFAAFVLALLAGAKLLLFAARRLPRRGLHPFLKHGIAALARPGSGTAVVVVALGLGAMVVTSTWIVEAKLREAVLAEIPPDAPTAFFVDISPDRLEEFRIELQREGATAARTAPVLLTRITAIDGRPVEEILETGEDRPNQALRREQRLTWGASLPEDNVVTAGEPWRPDGIAEVSVERRFARRIGVDLGSTIGFDVRGEQVTLTVTSIREVKWQSLGMNFFLVAEPGAVEASPDFHVASARLSDAAAGRLQDRVAASFPSVSVIRVGPALELVLSVLTRIATGIRLLGAFTAIAGLAVLAGAVSAAAGNRGGEIALLKTLGVTRAGVAALFFTEYGLLGAAAGAIGAGGALLLAWGWLGVVADIDVAVPIAALPVTALGTGLLTAVCGVVAGARALTVRPIEALRRQ